MPYVSSDDILEARKMDLLTYLQNYEPQELVKFSADTYTTKSHDSLKISNGKWMWWSRGIGGYTALDYLVKVENMSFIKAVETIIGRCAATPPTYVKPSNPAPKVLLLPPKSSSETTVISYLCGRGIDREILKSCIVKVYHTTMLFSSALMKVKNRDMLHSVRQMINGFWAIAQAATNIIRFGLQEDRVIPSTFLSVRLTSYPTQRY